MSAGGLAVMSHFQKRMDNPTCSPFSSYANPNSVAITTLPRNSQRLTDRFFVHERAVTSAVAKNLTPAPRRFG
jgi:hypothetical protein